MDIEKVHEGIRYTLTNDNLQVNDKVFSIGWGRCLGGDGWILHELNFKESMSGFPNEPHIILDLKYSDYKPYEVRTDKGFSPRESYYKIIKKEKQVKGERQFESSKWVEITDK